MDQVAVTDYEFHNVIPHVVASSSMSDVDPELLLQKVSDKSKVIALGGFVSRVCHKYGISHLRIDHPSPLNRNLNDAQYEMNMLMRLKEYIDV